MFIVIVDLEEGVCGCLGSSSSVCGCSSSSSSVCGCSSSDVYDCSSSCGSVDIGAMTSIPNIFVFTNSLSLRETFGKKNVNFQIMSHP